MLITLHRKPKVDPLTEKGAWRNVARSESGALVLEWILAQAGIDGATAGEFHQGRQSLGYEVRGKLLEHASEAYLAMVTKTVDAQVEAKTTSAPALAGAGQ